jgi:hypothetical protein
MYFVLVKIRVSCGLDMERSNAKLTREPSGVSLPTQIAMIALQGA